MNRIFTTFFLFSLLLFIIVSPVHAQTASSSAVFFDNPTNDAISQYISMDFIFKGTMVFIGGTLLAMSLFRR